MTTPGGRLVGEGLAIVSGGLLAVAAVGSHAPTTFLTLLLAAVLFAVPLAGVHLSERRRERDRLAGAHGLTNSDARTVMRIVDQVTDASWGIQPFLRPAARDYAQRQLERGPIPVWKLVMRVVLAAVVLVIFAVASIRDGASAMVVIAVAYLAQAGYLAYRAHQRPTRMRAVLASLGTDS